MTNPLCGHVGHDGWHGLSNRVKFALVFAVLGLHTLRNVSFVIFLMFYVPIALVLSAQFISRVANKHTGAKWGPLLVFLLVSILGLVTSLLFISPAGAMYGMSRFLYAIPVLFALYLYTESWDELRQHLVTFVVFFGVAGLSLPLQFLTGPIPWLADASERAGLERFSSIIGSLTSIGVVVGCYLVIVQAVQARFRWLWVLAIALPAVISLNKSAIVNLAAGALLLIYFNRRAFSKMAVAAVAVAGIAVAFYGLVPEVSRRVDATLVSFGVVNAGVLNYDVAVGQSALDRLITLPLANFAALAELNSPLVYLVGGGFGMGDTALVPKTDSLAPMAHNQFAEVITVFGLIGGSALIISLLVVLYRLITLYRSARRTEVQVVLGSYVLLLINSFFANGTIYQPAAAGILFLAMFLAVFGHTLRCDGSLPDSVHMGRMAAGVSGNAASDRKSVLRGTAAKPVREASQDNERN